MRPALRHGHLEHVADYRCHQQRDADPGEELDRLLRDRVFARLEEAVEHAEAELLAEHASELPENRHDAAEALERIGIPPSVIGDLLPHLSEMALAPGDVLIRAGDLSDVFFVLVEGSVDVSIQIGIGQRTRLQTLMAGTMVGEMALLSRAPRAGSVVATRPSILSAKPA